MKHKKNGYTYLLKNPKRKLEELPIKYKKFTIVLLINVEEIMDLMFH